MAQSIVVVRLEMGWIMSENPRKFWKQALAAGAECLTPDHFADGLSEAQVRHLETCPRCQAEKALWSGFIEDMPAGAEQGAVRWIAAETERRMRPAEPVRGGFALGWLNLAWARSWAGGLAAAALVLAIGYYTTGSRVAPVPGQPSINDTFRSGSVETLEPKGDQDAAPQLLRWSAVAGAASYEVSISEVDGTVMWSGQSQAGHAAIPEAIRAKLTPGKTVTWKVTAKNAGGTPMAMSPEERFRVKPKSASRGD